MQTERRQSLNIIFNSAASYLLSYLFVYLMFQLTTILFSYIYDIPTTLFHNRIGYNVRPEAWTFDSVKVIFTSGNLLLFLMTITFLVIIFKAMEYDGFLRLFFVWAFIHSVSMLLGSLIIGAFNFEGFGIVMSYLYLTDTIKMLLLFCGLLLLLIIGMLMVKPLLFTANIYYRFLSPDMRPAFRMNQFILPFLISTPILFFIKFPLTLYDALMLLVPFFILLPMFWGIGRFPVFYFEETKKSINLKYGLITFTVLLFLIYRIWTGIGINI